MRIAPPFAARHNRGSQTSCRPCKFKKKKKILAYIKIWISLYIYVSVSAYILILIVAPPFAARHNLGSRPSCQPWALKKKYIYIFAYIKIWISLYIYVSVSAYILFKKSRTSLRGETQSWLPNISSTLGIQKKYTYIRLYRNMDISLCIYVFVSAYILFK